MCCSRRSSSRRPSGLLVAALVVGAIWLSDGIPFDIHITHLVWRLIGAAAVGLQLFTGLWAFADAERRGLSGWLVGLLVAFVGWPLSALVWLGIRDRWPLLDADDDLFREDDLGPAL